MAVKICSSVGCSRRAIINKHICLAHASEQMKDIFFGSLRPGSNVDLREAEIDQSTLDKLFRTLSNGRSKIIFGQAQFDDTTFKGPISFNNVTFRGDASFNHAKFQDHVSFMNTMFEGRSSFIGAEISARNNFSADFLGPADFRNTIFGVHATFTNARFMSDASFNRTQSSRRMPVW